MQIKWHDCFAGQCGVVGKHVLFFIWSGSEQYELVPQLPGITGQHEYNKDIKKLKENAQTMFDLWMKGLENV